MKCSLKVRSHMRGADAGGNIGFNANHYMCSHIRSRGAEPERDENPLRNKWVQHPIFHVCFEAACSKPSEMADLPASTLRICEHTRGSVTGMSKSARLRSANTLHMCERTLPYHRDRMELNLICLTPVTGHNSLPASADTNEGHLVTVPDRRLAT